MIDQIQASRRFGKTTAAKRKSIWEERFAAILQEHGQDCKALLSTGDMDQLKRDCYNPYTEQPTGRVTLNFFGIEIVVDPSLKDGEWRIENAARM